MQQPLGLGELLWGPRTAARQPGAEKRAPGAGLPTPEEAQRLQLVRLPRLLSADERSELLSEAAAIRRGAAGAVRLQSAAERGREPGDEGRARGDWVTTYLHAMRAFQTRLPHLHAKIKAAGLAVDAERWGIGTRAVAASGEGTGGTLSTRCVELHIAGVTGALPQPCHYDHGSCITVGVMLQKSDRGGHFETLEVDGRMQVHEFEVGDALVFPSHKFHSVSPVEAGVRCTLVMELWVGEERGCNHRCETHFGACSLEGRVHGSWNNATQSFVAW